MNKVYNYNDFLIEKEFENLVYHIYRILENHNYSIFENEDKFNVGDTITWDITKTRSEKIKGAVDSFKNRIKEFGDWLRDPDSDVEIKFENSIIDLIKGFLSKVKDKEEIKRYFYKLIDELSSLPNSIKKDLFLKITSIFIISQSFITINDLATPEVINKEPIMAEVKNEISKKNPDTLVKDDFVDSDDNMESKRADFKKAQAFIKSVEGGYSDDKGDTGNYIDVPGGKRFLGTNHGISAPILLKYFQDKGIKRLPTRKDMEDLKEEVALEIYRKDYWDNQNLGDFKSQSIANVLYDGCVNQGPGATFGVLKNSLGDMGFKTDTISVWKDIVEKPIDGNKPLIDHVNDLSNKQNKRLFKLIKKFRLKKYEDAPTFYRHGDGWKKRLDDLSYVDDNIDTQDLS
jgi:lysozyme family protein